MFGNLIESGSHATDVRRKSSFFLLTLGGYALAIMLAGVASIYAYDAQLEQANFNALEQIEAPEITFIEPEDFKPAPTANNTPAPISNQSVTAPQIIIREIAQASIDNPLEVGDVSTVPNKHLSLPNFNADSVVRGTDSGTPPVGTSNPTGSPFGNSNASEGASRGRAVQPPPLPPVQPTPSPESAKNIKTISKGVVNGLAIHKPEPPYPPLAKQARVTGIVTIQIVIDETGKVVAAQILSGHPLLRQAALDAARRARFTPTKLSDVPVKVQGTITYNFKLE